MAHYADLNENGIVTYVFVGVNENENNIDWEQEYGSVRTSYNTFGGIHYDPETGLPSEDQSKAFRYNYAGIGYKFDPNFGPDGAFIPPKPDKYPSWILNSDTALWEPPVPKPNGDFLWNEETLSWEMSPQPYPSWTWDGSYWQPPTPMPETGGPWKWDEKTLSWILYDDIN